MPEIDGLRAMRHIVSEHPTGQRPRIVALTANAFDEDREACLAAGMDDYLSKPLQKNSSKPRSSAGASCPVSATDATTP